jgi:hypothetical protein
MSVAAEDHTITPSVKEAMAQTVFAAAIKHRPRIRLTIRQRTHVLKQWLKAP